MQEPNESSAVDTDWSNILGKRMCQSFEVWVLGNVNKYLPWINFLTENIEGGEGGK